MWLKGNTHTHTTKSDGSKNPEEMVRKYKEEGYDFVALTDHVRGREGRPDSEFTYDYDVDVEGIIVLNGAELSRKYHVTCIKKDGIVYKQVNHPMRWGTMNINLLNKRAKESNAHHVELTNHAKGYCQWPSQCDIITKTNLDPITSDDAHNYGQVGNTVVVVNSKSKKPKDILKSLIKGRYAIGGYWS